MMSQYDTITYGVFILDVEEWRQVSEHKLLPQAIERACESHDLLGAQIQVRSSLGILLLEIPSRTISELAQDRRFRIPRPTLM